MKKYILLAVVLGLIAFAIASVDLVESKPIPLPEPSTDPALAFPQYDQIYRDVGRITKHLNSQWTAYNYLQFHENGMVMKTVRSASHFNDLTNRFYRKLAEELKVNGEGDLRQVGRYTLGKGTQGEGTLAFTLGAYQKRVPKGTPTHTPTEWYHVEFNGDQIRVSRARADNGEPHGEFVAYAPIGPEARWETMPKEDKP